MLLVPAWHCCSKPEELVHTGAMLESGVQLIKRFTGGGTVVVDQDTVFGTLIFQAGAGSWAVPV